ncbi:MAG: hypothetical protein HY978_04640 [Candidatus Liptonbacteria bacterium]|nr:hypothetical protein [Candidatus Liptonbacteria bacterium]
MLVAAGCKPSGRPASHRSDRRRAARRQEEFEEELSRGIRPPTGYCLAELEEGEAANFTLERGANSSPRAAQVAAVGRALYYGRLG